MGQKGRIFDIQRFCVTDGPGIRTTVFFKGCPLRCKWCHNPESYLYDRQLSFLKTKCTLCGVCEAVCPTGAHLFENGEHHIEYSRCISCGECQKVCCSYALELLGEDLTVEALAERILIDKRYYGEKGGVTFSGGEPMMQPEFVISLAKYLKSEGIHLCLETSGYAQTIWFEKILPYIDIFLYDYKASDPHEHRELTGRDNFLIMQNLDFLCGRGAHIILRCPLVKDVNDSEEHLQAIADISRKYEAVRGVEVMAYHNMGLSKAEQIGIKPEVTQKTTEEGQKETWIGLLHKKGCTEAIIG
uniref:glycyl-radical enzyme activating protein n=1 Tax=Faecalicatena contorta TaxID=39482 RepID=UPI00359C7635